ncbi:hypothetical protein SAMN03097708_03093 [Thiohalomonas denitrificans]|uniref:Uncharacterized protein n=1 Tax=Thiohalomonas denitrificans TaxID=415747 RepID=A0A1G5QZA5_9GAMM|nr:hypothetical protein SAMN03097708_03093 [Thiohalomonas denitrificans]
MDETGRIQRVGGNRNGVSIDPSGHIFPELGSKSALSVDPSSKLAYHLLNTPAKPMPTSVGTLKSCGFFYARRLRA